MRQRQPLDIGSGDARESKVIDILGSTPKETNARLTRCVG
jgi:hypothetical protein